MRIAFASCTNIEHYPAPGQTVWQDVRSYAPDVLLLLGDNIYMDYFPRLREPARWPLERFAGEMHRRYAAQYEEPNFHALVLATGTIGATWDDHDFAWNNACGGDPDFPADRARISRALFHQFREALRAKPARYPQFDYAQLLASPDGDRDVHESFASGEVRFTVLDVRSYRRSLGHPPHPDTAFLGAAQEEWLGAQLSGPARVHVVAGGSTLSDFSGLLVDSSAAWEHWSLAYFRFLEMAKGRRVVYLGGDIHENRFREHVGGEGRLFEAISSGAAMRKYWIAGARRNYGLADIGEHAITLRLVSKDCFEEHRIDIASWREAPAEGNASRIGNQTEETHGNTQIQQRA